MADDNQERRPLTSQELGNIKQRLLDQKKSLWREISEDIQKDAGEEHRELLQAITHDFGDRAMAELRESTIYAYVEMKAKELESIEEALNRLESGKYGQCLDCGRWIRPARLEIVPHTIRCSACKEKWEKLYK